MEVLEKLEPAEVFRYFREISKIPRGSGNEKGISDYLVSFAKKHHLEVIQDKALNVIIKKPGSKGYENSPGIVIQGHMDMVCEKRPDIKHDFLKDPLELRVVDDMLYAAGTTLGGDDGIAVAMGMAILASEEIAHPPIELLITTSEETGMDGAMALDPANISGKTLINLDSEEEGILTVSCSGGCSARIRIPAAWETANPHDRVFAITVEGLRGGHSGVDIHKGRANANKLMARLLQLLNTKIDFRLGAVDGGSKHNAIARDARAIVCISQAGESALQEQVSRLEKILHNEFKTADPDIRILVKAAERAPGRVMTRESAENVIHFLYLIPNGVQSMSMDIPGLVESSLNLGVVETKESGIEIISSIRSSVGSVRENIFNALVVLGSLANGNVSAEAQYPEWQYNPDSKIREVFIAVYEKMFGQKPLVTAIHAGLECALFAEKFNGQLDMISAGPTIIGVHTAEEHLNIPSTQRTWNYLLDILKALK
ncbi:aminoacyl-histidine dipeptidase [Acetonema longum]|uniref:Cytosol non-specific dipeptidase n=1 Tax=Acetonema longum DSM 6540 TaxID=1009370 RepID=F7NMG4_9FIRM|nr:aminoacyl-histidine dipeptidase [Acetonema longum]EGO62762.1 aminoacyl-histidine dipeptidase [Acetonema longum DSM 6540]